MSVADGSTFMRWKCDDRGCYNLKQRPKFHVFASVLPGKIALTDIDATVEINGHFLFLEFKSGAARDIPAGQRIYFQRLTALSDRITVVIVCADAETMAVSAVLPIAKGRLFPWEACSLDALKYRIEKWVRRVRVQAIPLQRRVAA